MGRWHPYRSVILVLGGLYAGLYLSQKFSIPPVAAPVAFAKKVTAVASGGKPIESLEVLKGSLEWLAELKKRNYQSSGSAGSTDGASSGN